MDPDTPIDIQAFSVLVAQRGLIIESDDMLERLYAGYCSLQELTAQLPGAPSPATDPALVFLGDASEISR
jgi:hypothetical protein